MNKTITPSREHYNKYRDMSKKTGINYTNLTSVLGYDKESMLKLYKSDKNLNNIPLRKWDMIAESTRQTFFKTIGKWSLCLGVCTAKHCTVYQFLGIKFKEGEL